MALTHHLCVLKVAGAAAVFIKGGPACKLLMGRPDIDTLDDISNLPNPCDSATTLKRHFGEHGSLRCIRLVGKEEYRGNGLSNVDIVLYYQHAV